jgi:hypothetical protein
MPQLNGLHQTEVITLTRRDRFSRHLVLVMHTRYRIWLEYSTLSEVLTRQVI